MLRGEEAEQRCDLDPHSGQIIATGRHTFRPLEVAAVSAAIGDVHAVRNAPIDRPSINIGAVHRHVFDLAHHARKDFVSGYKRGADAEYLALSDRPRQADACRHDRGIGTRG